MPKIKNFCLQTRRQPTTTHLAQPLPAAALPEAALPPPPQPAPPHHHHYPPPPYLPGAFLPPFQPPPPPRDSVEVQLLRERNADLKEKVFDIFDHLFNHCDLFGCLLLLLFCRSQNWRLRRPSSWWAWGRPRPTKSWWWPSVPTLGHWRSRWSGCRRHSKGVLGMASSHSELFSLLCLPLFPLLWKGWRVSTFSILG